MMIILTIEYINGDIDVILVQRISERKHCLKYWVKYGEDRGEYSVPFQSIKKWKIVK